MHVQLSTGAPESVSADWIAVCTGSGAAELGISDQVAAVADPLAIVQTAASSTPIALVAAGPGADGLRTAAARAVRTAAPGQTIAWAFDRSSPIAGAEQLRAVAEGAVIADYECGRPPTDTSSGRRLVICGADPALQHVVDRAVLVAGWGNLARELVDAPPNQMLPADLADRATQLPGVSVQVVDPATAGLGGLSAVGGSSEAPPLLLVLEHRPSSAGEPVAHLAFVGKGVTFDSGGLFLKGRGEIVRQKADMAGGAAVIAALGAIAELGLPVAVTGIVPACENLVSATAPRPTDVITTASGLTVEVVNPDAEGRLILADGLWYARGAGATHLVDLATLTGGVPDALGDLHAGVFGNDERWRDEVVASGNASGDLAWPLPLHARFESWLRSPVADLRNVAGRQLGFSVFAATFLARFAGDLPWAHVDMLGTAMPAEDRGDAFGAGATGYGVRMLVELATRAGTGGLR